MEGRRLHIGDYRLRFGEIPGQDLLALLGVTELSDAQARLLREGMEVLVGYLASVRDGWEDEDAPVHQERPGKGTVPD